MKRRLAQLPLHGGKAPPWLFKRMTKLAGAITMLNPSPEDVDDYVAALTKAGVEHTFYRYDGAGHAFQSFNNEERYHPQASEDAWEKVLGFFEEKLKITGIPPGEPLRTDIAG